MRRRLFLVITVMAAVSAIALGQAAASEAIDPPRDHKALEHYAEVRASFGLPADVGTIESLMATFGLDPEWGLPFSSEEKAEMDRRVDIQNLFSESSTALFQLPGFAGFYFDHTAGGAPTLLTTQVESAELALADAIGRELARLVQIRPAVWTYQQLKDAVDQLGWRMAEGIEYRGFDFTNVTVVRLDTPHNRVVVGVDPAAFGPSVRLVLQDLTRVPVIAEPMERPQPEVCTSRLRCFNPLRAGVEIRLGGLENPPVSTLGFGVWYGSDKQYLTTAHSGSGTFLHSTMTIGSTQQHGCYVYGCDVQRISAADLQVSNRIYMGPSTYLTVVGAVDYPAVGTAVCISGLNSGYNCGQVTDDYVEVTTCDSMTVAAMANYTAISGDSGAPIFTRQGSTARAIGIHGGGIMAEFFARWDYIRVILGVSPVI